MVIRDRGGSPGLKRKRAWVAGEGERPQTSKGHSLQQKPFLWEMPRGDNLREGGKRKRGRGNRPPDWCSWKRNHPQAPGGKKGGQRDDENRKMPPGFH